MQKRLIHLIIILFSIQVYAQSPQKTLDLRFGGNSRDKPFFVSKTNDGGYIVTGWSNSGISNDKTQSNRGDDDFWILKLNSNFQKVWDKTLGGNRTDAALKFIENPDGSILLIGHGNSDIGFDKTSKVGLRDFWVVKISSNGDKIWDRAYGGSQDDVLTSAVTTQDGNFILFGYTYSPASGNITENSRGGSTDLWYLKIDGNGNIIWQKRIGGNSYEESHKILKVDNLDEYYLLGTTYSAASGEVSQPNSGNGTGDLWLIKINGSGQIIWEKRFGGSADEYWPVGKIATNGDIIIAGESNSNISGNKTQNSWSDSKDFWVIRVNSAGNLIWDKRYGGYDDDMPFDLLIKNNGDIIVAGQSNSGIGGDKTQTLRSNASFMNGSKAFDYWVVKLNPSGNLIWDARYGGDVNDELRCAYLDGDNILLFGFSNSTISGDKTVPLIAPETYYAEDYWFVKIVDGVCQENNTVNTIDITPSNTVFTVSNQITSNAVILPSEKVSFKAGKSILLTANCWL